jgi:hypothetical protein
MILANEKLRFDYWWSYLSTEKSSGEDYKKYIFRKFGFNLNWRELFGLGFINEYGDYYNPYEHGSPCSYCDISSFLWKSAFIKYTNNFADFYFCSFKCLKKHSKKIK